eukprot:m.94676 g.94676  ORF g.94676 m.94676 type:complete len:472 (+) comp15417_c0_seq1:107-1522(+)
MEDTLDWVVKLLHVEGIPVYHLVLEGLLVVAVIKLLFFSKRYSLEEKTILTPKEEQALLDEWQPTSLVNDNLAPHDPPVVEGPITTHVTIKGKDKINMATYNFLECGQATEMQKTAKDAIRTYGVGSCGPRGFYGTIDVHLDLEAKIAKILGMEEAILYSYAFSAVSSVVPAYAKRGDVLFCDEGVSFALQKGLTASRSTIKLFKHNDMEDLERLLILQAEEDKKDPKKAAATRRFLLVEGLYLNHGDIAPLKKLVELKYKYKVRIFIDETYSFGVLGEHGRGLTEHFGVPSTDIDIIMGSLETSLGSIGGFACGRSYVIDHQRLAGLGYCFSASLPPYLAKVALTGLDDMVSNAEPFNLLRSNLKTIRPLLKKIRGLRACGDEESPIIHLRLDAESAKKFASVDAQEQALQAIVDKALEAGLALTRAKYYRNEEMRAPEPSIRLTVMAGHTKAELEKAASVISTAASTVL